MSGIALNTVNGCSSRERLLLGVPQRICGGIVVAVALGVLVLLGMPGSALAGSSGACINEGLRSELGSSFLPDCRAYEMVTPPYKEGYNFYVLSYSSSGDQAIVSSLADVAGNPGAGESNLESEVYLDQRTADGWQLSPLNSSLSNYVGQIAISAEADSGLSLWEQHTPKQPYAEQNLYVRSASGAFSLIGPLNLPLTAEEEKEESDLLHVLAEHGDSPIAATGNYDHVVLLASRPENYWPFDQTQSIGGSLYEYSGTGNKQPILVGVEGEKGSDTLVGQCGTLFGSGTSSEGSKYNALSSDGETIFFTVLEKGYNGCSAAAPVTAEVYARLHGSLVSTVAAKTVDVSASECAGTCGSGSGKNFEGASENGEKVFFTSTQKLTNSAVDGSASGNAAEERGCAATAGGSGGCNLYEYDFGLPGIECQQEGKCLSLVAGGEVLGVAGIAEDGTWVYFVSRAKLSTGDNEYGRGPLEGSPNLYAYDSVSGSTAFVATLGGSDESMWTRSFVHPVEVAGGDGQFLLFASETEGVTPDDLTEKTQLFEYDAETAELVRVTQGEDGFNDNGIDVRRGTSSEAITSVAQKLGGTYDFKSGTNQLNVAVDGKRVVFRSRARLSPLAFSAESEEGCFNVYEFEWGSRLSEGVVRLLSDGRDVQPLNNGTCGATFQAIDANGENVLFTTADPLLASDVDGFGRDIYDARVGGGLAPVSSATGGSVCVSAGCDGSVSRTGSVPLAGSLSETPEGNVSPPPSKAGTGTASTQTKKAKAKKLTRAVELAKALKACKGKPKRRRAVCEKAARRRYASKAKAKKSGRGGR
jgi:hypothetical protein